MKMEANECEVVFSKIEKDEIGSHPVPCLPGRYQAKYDGALSFPAYHGLFLQCGVFDGWASDCGAGGRAVHLFGSQG